MLAMALAVVFGTHISAPADVDAASFTATANLNIRSGPATTFPVIGSILSGATVEVTGDLQSNFYPVSYSGINGFSSADFLTAGSGGGDDGGSATGPTGTRFVRDGRLNLRSGPSTVDPVVAVMPEGATVQLTGQIASGFSQVTWNGTTGWAFTEFLSTEGGPAQPDPTPEPTAPPATPTEPASDNPPIGDTAIGTATVSTGGLNLNLRSGPGSGFGVLRSLPSGAQVDVMGEAQNGFRPVRYQGVKGWASADFLTIGAVSTPVTPTAIPIEPDGGVVGTATVTTVGVNLNMRSGPGTGFGVVRGIPSGAQVDVMGGTQNGFLPVRYLGSTGWSSTDFLRTGTAATPTPTTPPVVPTVTPDDPVTGAGVVNVARLNFRSGPGIASSVIGVLTNGTQVSITGAAENGFLPIRANNRDGWASAEFITVSGGGTPTPTATPTATPTPTPTPTPTATPTPTIPPGGVIGTAVVSVSTTLNMRSGPGLDHPVIRGLANGSQVDLLGEARNGFRPIRYQGTEGWASVDFLDIGATNPDDPDVPPIGDQAIGKATINASVSLRRGPGSSFGHIQTLNNGWRVEIMGDSVNGWTPIRYNAAKGWAPSGNLTPGWGYQIVDQMITSRSQRMMSAPGGGPFVFWVPPGTLVDITGSASGVHVPARWAGFAGWLDSTLMYQPETFVDPGPANAHEAEMIAIIYQAADKWGQSRVDMLRVSRCESFLDPDIVNPASGTSGLFQFRPSTFAFTPNGQRGENIFDPWSNADAAGWMWANGMRHHWACQ